MLKAEGLYKSPTCFVIFVGQMPSLRVTCCAIFIFMKCKYPKLSTKLSMQSHNKRQQHSGYCIYINLWGNNPWLITHSRKIGKTDWTPICRTLDPRMPKTKIMCKLPPHLQFFFHYDDVLLWYQVFSPNLTNIRIRFYILDKMIQLPKCYKHYFLKLYIFEYQRYWNFAA